jgi:hypothetical protein
VRRFPLLLVVVAAACSKFEAANDDDETPEPALPRDAGSKVNDAGSADAPIDAFVPSDAQVLMATVMPNTTDFAADCTSYIVDDMNDAVFEESSCLMFFHNTTWRRTWPEANVLCNSITRGTQHAHLAAFTNMERASFVVETGAFPGTLVAWIGLALEPGAVATDKTSWSWVTGEPYGYDGWIPEHPTGPSTCAAWAGVSSPQWRDVPCDTPRGVLCEMNEPSD